MSRKWILPRSDFPPEAFADAEGNLFEALPPVSHQIVAYDFGLKRNILRSLRRNGFSVKVVPATTPADEVLAMNPEGVFLSNGPGDPAALEYAHEAVRGLIGKRPMFGICLGHQILALALGGRDFQVEVWASRCQPARQGSSHRQSRHHIAEPWLCRGSRFACQIDVEVTHVNLNDGTVAGLRHKEYPAFSVQYHPEASPGPHDASYFFAEFAKEVEKAEEKS